MSLWCIIIVFDIPSSLMASKTLLWLGGQSISRSFFEKTIQYSLKVSRRQPVSPLRKSLLRKEVKDGFGLKRLDRKVTRFEVNHRALQVAYELRASRDGIRPLCYERRLFVGVVSLVVSLSPPTSCVYHFNRTVLILDRLVNSRRQGRLGGRMQH